MLANSASISIGTLATKARDHGNTITAGSSVGAWVPESP